MTEVKITEDARDFILNKAGAVYVDALMNCAGCFNITMMPVVLVGEPPEPENYDQFAAGGIKVYIYKGAVFAKDGARIFLEGDRSVYQDLDVEGLRYPA